ncbi:MAG TPA: DinB family protein [Thermoanaerobaculia bacterium]
MDRDDALRVLLSKLLDWEDAHVSFDRAVDGIPPHARGARPEGAPHSPWQLIEHMRICQGDILEFCTNPRYVEMKFEDYWPRHVAPPSDRAWDESIAAFRRDRDALKALAADSEADLFAPIPHGSGQTYLRELALVADHNAYHVGQLVLLEKLLAIWPKAE